MKNQLKILIILLLPLAGFSQSSYSARLSFYGYVTELGVSPSEEIWVASKGGNVYYTKQIGDLWHFGPYGSTDRINAVSGNNFERITLFSEDTMMISGFIQENGETNHVLWSGDHGKTWEKIRFGAGSWIDAFYKNDNGKAWMSGSSQLIYYTADNGKTWKTFDKVEATGNLRFNTIHFAKDEKTGLFGSFWNVLYKTTDNCQTWEKLPTPLSQNKYERLSKEDRPDIRKIRMFGEYYIINQQGRVFITKSNVIDWTFLPDIRDFEVSESGELYTVNRDLSVSLYNTAFSQTWQSKQPLESFPKALEVKNNKLFAWTGETIYKINPDKFVSSQLYTDEIPIEKPYKSLSYEGEEYGFSDKDILQLDKDKQRWFRVMTVDFYISNACLFDNKIVLADEELRQHYVFNSKDKSVKKYNLPKKLFSGKDVIEVHFEEGSRGCFHWEKALRIYKMKNDKLVVDEEASSPKFLSGSVPEIDPAVIEQLVREIDESRFSAVSLKDLDITENDVQEFKRFIDKEEQKLKQSGIDRFSFDNSYIFPGENADFNFYRSAADSLSKIPGDEINNAFWQAYGNWSTTTDWRKITFVLQDGQKIEVENSDDHPNYLYTPWTVDFDGLKFRTNSILFGQEIEKITHGQFFTEVTRDKNYALFKIADYLYRKKLKEKQ